MFDFMRPVLSDKTILRYNKKNLLIEGEIKPEQLQPNSVDLTLAPKYSEMLPNVTAFNSVNPTRIDPAQPISYDVNPFFEINAEQFYVLDPGEFVLMASNEILNIPNGIISFVQGRSSIARIGIQTEQAGLIDAGFRGTITFEVFNQSKYPIKLYAGQRIAQVYFFKSQKAIHPYSSERNSKYNGQIDPTGSRIYKDFK